MGSVTGGEWSKEDVGVAVVQLSAGSLAGWAAGYALKTVGRVAAFAVGTGFIFVQGLAYSGYIHVDWGKIEKDYVRALDLDADGKVTNQDMMIMLERASAVMRYNVPSGVGFTLGMLQGMGAAASTLGKAAVVYGIGSRVILPRAAMAGAAGASTVGVPAFVVGMQERLGLKRISDDEMFQQALVAADPRELHSMRSSLEAKFRLSSPGEREDVQRKLAELTAKMEEKGLIHKEEPEAQRPKRWWKLRG
uniref:EF-hand domain-containing protein n=1 Tax=Compsopogon caeruleus TaxID=31354 RepID=A0A7S1T746_9RHOD|mmetsp:Transcript_12055/g.24542  ORF Transcript_12055/g.24542 Transcript_12055/m.24542 type:complete len:249 (+) Transcript_12055:1-747(+)